MTQTTSMGYEKMKKYTMGIDPGLNGCIVLHNHEDTVFFDMPTLEITRNGKKRRQIDLYALARFVDEHAENIEKAFIENPQGMPGMSANSTHQLGENVGIAKMAIAANFIPMELVAPATWKKAMGLTKDKDACRLKASQLAPKLSHYFARAKDDGRAESLLLAIWGIKKDASA